MYQQITIVGNLGGDPIMRYTESGVPVTSFSVATSRQWTDANGTKQEKTVWFRVTAWRRLAETTSQYLSKGRQVMVVGEMEPPNVYQGKDGEHRASLEVTARMVRFLSGGQEGNGNGPDHSSIGSTDMSDVDSIPF